MYEEIIWALKQKKEIAEQAGDLDEVERFKRMMKEEEEKMDGTWERRKRQQEKEREEKERQRQKEIEWERGREERERQEAIQKEKEAKEKKER